MPVVMRRVFYGKVGRGYELIARLQEGNILVRQQGMAIKPRILADYSSGRVAHRHWASSTASPPGPSDYPALPKWSSLGPTNQRS